MLQSRVDVARFAPTSRLVGGRNTLICGEVVQSRIVDAIGFVQMEAR
jgi:hypothetical protein